MNHQRHIELSAAEAADGVRAHVLNMKGNQEGLRQLAIHPSMTVWIGVVLCLTAIAIDLWSDDLSWRPLSHSR
jgi:hypothetical protein